MTATSRIACALALALALTCAGAQTAAAQSTNVCTITGGGQIDLGSGEEAMFGLAAIGPGLLGEQTYRDPEVGFSFHSEVVMNVFCFPTAIGWGAEINGQGRVVRQGPGGPEREEVLYRIRVQDSGEGSAIQGLDLYTIFLSNGYGQPERLVVVGNIRVEPGL